MINIKIFLLIDHQKKVERIYIVIQIYELHHLKEWIYKTGIDQNKKTKVNINKVHWIVLIHGF